MSESSDFTNQAALDGEVHNYNYNSFHTQNSKND